MQPRDVRVFLLDALTAAERIVVIRHQVGVDRLRTDDIVQAAIERHLITVGEALHKADDLDASIESRISHLRAIVGLRNRLVHGYFAIDWDRIVVLVEDDLDRLVTELRVLID